MLPSSIVRRAFYWIAPLAVAVLAAAIFASGFVTFLRGDIGVAVLAVSPRIHADEPSHATIVPLILGDSLARGTGDESGLGIGGRLAGDLKEMRMSARPVVNLAVNGARTGDLLRQLDSRNVRTLIADSNVIIISIGGNDLWGEANAGRPVQPSNPTPIMGEVLDRIVQIVGIVRATNGTARIFIVGLYNPFARRPLGGVLGALVADWNAKLIEKFAPDPNITIVPTSDIFSHRNRLSLDEFHPSDEGYALIARRIADSL